MEEIRIGDIRNYYGGLVIIKNDNKFYWGIENYDGIECEEIPESLYNALLDFQNKKLP